MGLCCSASGFAEGYEHGRHVSSIHLIKELSEKAEEMWATLAENSDARVEARAVREALVKRSPYVAPAHAQMTLARYFADNETIGSREFGDLFVEYHISTPTSVQAIYQDACRRMTSALTASDLGEFLFKTTGGLDHFSLSELDTKISFYEQNTAQIVKTRPPKGCMSAEAFAQLLIDGHINSFADKTKLKHVYQDMTRPLSEYYIASSHNSSLLGNQLTSRSSSEAIRRALLLGVRMIELDAWEGEDGEPIVTHGHTLVVPTTFAACIEVVREVGFLATKYPLILTIENHCGLEQQRRQAVILHEQLGPMLYGNDRDFASAPLQDLMRGEAEWKSPKELLGKVIIRDKPVKKLHRRDGRAGRRASAFLDMHRRRSAGLIRSGGAQAETLPASVFAMARAGFSAAKMMMASPSSDSLVATFPADDALEEDEDDDDDDDDDDDGGGDDEQNDARRNPKRAASDLGTSAAAVGLAPISEDAVADPADASSRRPSPERLASSSIEETSSDFVLPMSVVAVLADKFDRRSVAKRVSARLVRTLRPLSVDLARTASAVTHGTALENASASSVRPRGGFGEADDDDDDDDSGEIEFDEETLNTLERITEAIKARSAEPALLALMYIKNVKLRYKISPFGLDFVEPSFCSSSSIDERKLATLTKYPERSQCLASYCRRHIIRVYPAGQRFDSSNFDPLPAWSAGVQCVALNVQKNSPAVWISHGKFRDNGGAGYVLKPPTLRAAEANQVNSPEPVTLRIKVLSGHYLIPGFEFRDHAREPLQIPSEVYVEASVHGAKSDTSASRTRAVKRNCFNPAWNQTMQFPISRPDLAHVLIVVKDQEGQVVYQASLSLHCVREGYRVVPLATPSLAPSKHSFLFCKFEILQFEDVQTSPEEFSPPEDFRLKNPFA